MIIKELLKIGDKLIALVQSSKKVDQLAKVKAGCQPRKIAKNWNNGKVPFLNIGDLSNNPYVNHSKIKVNENAIEAYRCDLTTKYQILIGAVSPDINKISFVKKGFTFNSAIRALFINDINDSGQLFFALRNKARNLTRNASGSVQQQINYHHLKNLIIKFDKDLNDLFNFIINLIKIYTIKKDTTKKIINNLIIDKVL